MEIRKGRGSVYGIQYHLVWCVKYRKKILSGELDKRLKEIVKEQAISHRFTIIELETDLDNIHMLIECSPQHYIPNIVKALKGNLVRFLFKEFPSLKRHLWEEHLWNPSYFICTVSDRTEEQIKKYIQEQQTKLRERGRPK
ncbi:IS200/IS605 family transposase [Bacillus sp. V3B]|uniref:IS200/IS605 family transposase n=1 Tax=Bacillus sp. V3B TaxID=2804915 RepID=UPI00210CA189|nr:IS200/IS605 family transposase [Bacillus sp. V3B]MCQ6275907.1 IS200/IS605 family transposase [Bacillus sp. V3B]